MPTPYVTNTEADIFNDNTPGWKALAEATKTLYLEWGRRYIDLYYFCLDFDASDAPNHIKEANSILAKEHIKTPLYNIKPISNGIKKKTVKAGSVSTSTEYTGNKRGLTDPFPEVTMLLSETCSLQISSNIAFLQRA